MSSLIDNLLTKTFENFRRITPPLIAVALFTASLLFLPEPALEKMCLNALPILWKQIIGIAFLLSIILIAVNWYSHIRAKRANKRIKTNLKTKFKTLSPLQKDIVFSLLMSDNKKLSLDINSGDVYYLVYNHFLHAPKQIFTKRPDDSEMILTFVPHPCLLELFNEEPEIFEQ